jgi:hypothetical protein
MMIFALAAAGQRHRAARHTPPPEPQPQPQPQPQQPQRVVLTPSKDATLYQSSNGSAANGSGPHLFAGTTNTRDVRRALLAFDVASKIPAGSQISSVTLTLHISQTIAGSETMSLHAVTADWGEGASNAGAFRDGAGTGSKTNDATWIHTFFSSKRWARAGGDFASNVDATAAAEQSGDLVWGPADAMTARVQSWLDAPSANFGWIVLGNESASRSAKRFDSREATPESTRPTLTIDYVPPVGH